MITSRDNHLRMKTIFFSLGLMVVLSGCQTSTEVKLSEKLSNKPVTAHGYFKCNSGKLEIIGAGGSFFVGDEKWENYELNIVFAYKPMAANDVKLIEMTGAIGSLPAYQQNLITVEGFPGPFMPVLMLKLGEWPIGSPPPEKGDEIKNLYFRASGKTIPTINHSIHPEKWFVQWSVVPDKTEGFLIKGRCMSSETWSGCEWDITFEARALNWATGKYGLKKGR